ncbi:hypothetical protein CT154_07195 [Komagataeibacter xylinus]|uniref:hypothetical protein n=1 Tax=Komagataeibacter rhaeticus TaxID=215221 RepID=UPI00058769A7|nr:hypothetical protein [Komagataeibacter rhaeticus]ATU72660.1 hypothetical protein CT154_07195 [Komagataeibacter xylinus]WPP22423.1 hypothetical protein SCD25_02695 [Komagataeibacter rhaeticus]
MSDADDELTKEILAASREAPIVFTDHVPHFGHAGNIVAVTLSAGKPNRGGLAAYPVAHLRMPVPTAKLLIDSLQKALAMMEKENRSVN